MYTVYSNSPSASLNNNNDNFISRRINDNDNVYVHGVSSKKCQLEVVECSDRDSVSKEFWSRIVLGKKRNTCIHQYKQPEQ